MKCQKFSQLRFLRPSPRGRARGPVDERAGRDTASQLVSGDHLTDSGTFPSSQVHAGQGAGEGSDLARVWGVCGMKCFWSQPIAVRPGILCHTQVPSPGPQERDGQSGEGGSFT